jgi:hypothetical protein
MVDDSSFAKQVLTFPVVDWISIKESGIDLSHTL